MWVGSAQSCPDDSRWPFELTYKLIGESLKIFVEQNIWTVIELNWINTELPWAK